jgi:hypothetical protein
MVGVSILIETSGVEYPNGVVNVDAFSATGVNCGLNTDGSAQVAHASQNQPHHFFVRRPPWHLYSSPIQPPLLSLVHFLLPFSRPHCLAIGSFLLSLLAKLRIPSRCCWAPFCDNAPFATAFVPRVTTSTTRVLGTSPYFAQVGHSYSIHPFFST